MYRVLDSAEQDERVRGYDEELEEAEEREEKCVLRADE